MLKGQHNETLAGKYNKRRKGGGKIGGGGQGRGEGGGRGHIFEVQLV